MISWRASRIICMLLLALPIVHLTYLVSRDTLATLDPSPEAWAPQMDAFQREDETTPLPSRPVEVVGGHRVNIWDGLENILAPAPVLMRGLGNATVDDVIYHYDRLIGYYRPDTLVFLPGDAEFHIRDNKDADDLVRGIQELVAQDALRAGTRRIYIFTPLKTPLHPGDREKVEKTVEMLQAWAADVPRVSILDANRLLCDPDGKPDPGYFRFDGVNLNEHGYLRLSLLLKTAVESDAGAIEAAET